MHRGDGIPPARPPCGAYRAAVGQDIERQHGLDAVAQRENGVAQVGHVGGVHGWPCVQGRKRCPGGRQLPLDRPQRHLGHGQQGRDGDGHGVEAGATLGRLVGLEGRPAHEALGPRYEGGAVPAERRQLRLEAFLVVGHPNGRLAVRHRRSWRHGQARRQGRRCQRRQRIHGRARGGRGHTQAGRGATAVRGQRASRRALAAHGGQRRWQPRGVGVPSLCRCVRCACVLAGRRDAAAHELARSHACVRVRRHPRTRPARSDDDDMALMTLARSSSGGSAACMRMRVAPSGVATRRPSLDRSDASRSSSAVSSPRQDVDPWLP